MEKSIVSKNYVNLKRVRRRKRLWRQLPFHLMLLPGVILVFIYMYLPMIGLKIAFENFIPAKGLFGPQKFVGMRNFQMLLRNPQTMPALRNTIIISAWKMALHLLVPVIVSILLNEIQSNAFRRLSQTLIYLPHFLSWIILAGILIDLLSPNGGLVNRLLGLFGAEPIFFLGSNKWFRFTLVFTDVWKEFGFGTIVYLAAITNIDPTQYEAATIDGCSKYQIYSRIILPLMKPSIVTTVIIQFYWKWDDYMGPLLYLSRPQSYTVSIAIKLFADSASTTDYGAMFAMSTLSLIPVFLIFLFFNRYLVQGIGTSGLKG